jgi:hypothetical protein
VWTGEPLITPVTSLTVRGPEEGRHRLRAPTSGEFSLTLRTDDGTLTALDGTYQIGESI